MADEPLNTGGDQITDGKTPEQDGQQAHDQLLSKTAERLAAFNKLNDDPDADVQPESEPVEKPRDDVEPEGDKDEDIKPDAAAVDAGKSTKPTLPAAYRRSLTAYDWTKEEIDEAFDAAPESFLKTAERIHRNRNAETAQFAELGRKAREASGISPTKATEVVTPTAGPNGVELVDTEKLVEEFGNEDLVNRIAGPVNAVITEINKFLPELRGSVSTIQRSTKETLAKQIEDFFTSPDMKTFGDFYGSLAKEPLSDDQQRSRSKVLETADAIISGASLQGRQMSVDEALLMAHDSVASKLIATKVREEIKASTKTRARGITLKPESGGGPSTDDSRPSTRRELEAKAREGLSKVFGT